MKIKNVVIILTLLMFMLSAAFVMAQEEKKQKDAKNLCEVILRPTKIDNHFEIEIMLTNDQPIAAMSLPFSITAGEKLMTYDSISFKNTRAEECTAKIPNADTTNQKFNLGILASMTPPLKYIDPGTGPLAKIYYTGEKGVKMTEIVIDTTFFPPSNHLKAVPPDATSSIYPDFKFTLEDE